jgi:hypothetical protein
MIPRACGISLTKLPGFRNALENGLRWCAIYWKQRYYKKVTDDMVTNLAHQAPNDQLPLHFE